METKRYHDGVFSRHEATKDRDRTVSIDRELFNLKYRNSIDALVAGGYCCAGCSQNKTVGLPRVTRQPAASIVHRSTSDVLHSPHLWKQKHTAPKGLKIDFGNRSSLRGVGHGSLIVPLGTFCAREWRQREIGMEELKNVCVRSFPVRSSGLIPSWIFTIFGHFLSVRTFSRPDRVDYSCTVIWYPYALFGAICKYIIFDFERFVRIF